MITKPVGTKDELTQNVLRTSPNDNRTGDVSSNKDETASGNKKRNVSIIFTTLLCLTVVVIASVALTTTVTSKAEDVKRVRRDISYQQCRAVCRKEFRIPPLVLISLDGFWAQYLERGLAPNLESVAECGVRAKYMRPVFPTKTFPNHYSIATGLYPESHGIIDNRMWDPSVEGENFKASTTVPGFYLGEPIWNTVIKNGQKSAVFFWPGSEAEVGGLKPTYFMKYNGSVPFSTRVDQIVQWLLLPEDQRPSFVAAYISQPDENGHKYGPFSEKIDEAITLADSVVGKLIKKLDKVGLLGCVNLVIVSDHGMQEIDPHKGIALERVMSPTKSKLFGGPVGRIQFGNVTEGDVKFAMKKVECKKGKKFKVYTKSTIPRRYHYRSNNRIGNLVFSASLGAITTTNVNDTTKLLNGEVRGNHGYDSLKKSMRAIFFAMGPNIRRKYEVEPFQNIELYNLFVDLMKLPLRAPNNGTRGRLNEILRSPRPVVSYSVEPKIIDGFPRKICSGCSNQCKVANWLEKCKRIRAGGLRTEFCSNLRMICKNFCDTSVCFDDRNFLPTVTISSLTASNFLPSDTFTRHECFLGAKSSCNTWCSEFFPIVEQVQQPLSFANRETMQTVQAALQIRKGITTKIWQRLNDKIREYLKLFGQLLIFAGPVYDFDFDGRRDDISFKKLFAYNFSDIFIVMLRCNTSGPGWTRDGTACVDPNDASVLSYIFPNVQKDLNCLEADEYMEDNVASVRDIERLTGLEFFTDRKKWPEHIALRLRTVISENL